MSREAVIVSAVRTPMGSFNGAFSQAPATALGSAAISEALKRIHLGCVLSAGLGQAPARQASIGAGIPHSVGATTVNKVCGSSIQAVILAAQAIAVGEARMVVAGGMENMTRAPFLLEKTTKKGTTRTCVREECGHKEDVPAASAPAPAASRTGSEGRVAS